MGNKEGSARFGRSLGCVLGGPMEIIIPGDTPTKKNSQRLVYAGGRPYLLPSAAYRRWEDGCAAYLPQVDEPISEPVHVRCLFYRRTRRAVDKLNLLEAVDDMLVHHGVLKDDNCRIVVHHDGSRVLYDKDNPRVEILIEPCDEPTL